MPTMTMNANPFKADGMIHHGQYFTVGTFIAFRDEDHKWWRMSEICYNYDGSFLLKLIGQFEHSWEVRQKADEIAYQSS